MRIVGVCLSPAALMAVRAEAFFWGILAGLAAVWGFRKWQSSLSFGQQAKTTPNGQSFTEAVASACLVFCLTLNSFFAGAVFRLLEKLKSWPRR